MNMMTRIKSRLKRAFSLIEIMVAVALLAVIILGLVAMFDQTRRAFATGMSQGDYTESARVALDMMAREVEQMRPTGGANANFYVDVPGAPAAWPLTTPPDAWTNVLERLFFVTRYNREWTVIGYRLDPAGVSNQVGTLYRYSSNNVQLGDVEALRVDFLADTPVLPLQRIIDGVVDFRVRAYDKNGVLVENNPLINNPTNFLFSITNLTLPYNDVYVYGSYSNAVPAYVELELAVLEDRALERWRSLSDSPTNAAAYLTRQAGKVHVFRQRVPIRGMDPTVYP